MKKTQLFDIRNEFCIFRFNDGFKVIPPDQIRNNQDKHNGYNTNYMVGDVLNFSCNTFFVDHNLLLRNVNELAAEACGFDSVQSAIGKSAFDFAIKDSAHYARLTDQKVMMQRKIGVFEQNLIRIDHELFHYILIKAPWYDLDNNVIGLFGFALAVGKQNISISLLEIAKFGVLNFANSNFHSDNIEKNKIHGQHLSKRETEILQHLVRGKTAKAISIVLELSRRTVESHIERIKIKLCASSKSELIDKVIDHFI